MQIVITLKLDARMKKAIQTLAEKKFMSMSGLIKACLQEKLDSESIDWRNEPASKSKTPPKKGKRP